MPTISDSVSAAARVVGESNSQSADSAIDVAAALNESAIGLSGSLLSDFESTRRRSEWWLPLMLELVAFHWSDAAAPGVVERGLDRWRQPMHVCQVRVDVDLLPNDLIGRLTQLLGNSNELLGLLSLPQIYQQRPNFSG